MQEFLEAQVKRQIENIATSHWHSNVASVLFVLALYVYFRYNALDAIFVMLACIAHVLNAIYHSVRKD